MVKRSVCEILRDKLHFRAWLGTKPLIIAQLWKYKNYPWDKQTGRHSKLVTWSPDEFHWYFLTIKFCFSCPLSSSLAHRLGMVCLPLIFYEKFWNFYICMYKRTKFGSYRSIIWITISRLTMKNVIQLQRYW